MLECRNEVFLCGRVAETPVHSHDSHGKRYYLFYLDTERLSGAIDHLRVLASEEQLKPWRLGRGDMVCVEGTLRSFNNRASEGSRLIIAVLARTLNSGALPFENQISIVGTLCKQPIYRRTPLGREITDMIIAVNRRHGRADYLPAIAWGAGARVCAQCGIGQRLCLDGRIQSRGYIKVTEAGEQRKVAFEVSVARVEVLEK